MEYSKIEEYTTDYIYSLPDGERAELIDGIVYNMASPNMIHQAITTKLSQLLGDYIDLKNGSCMVFVAPFAVFLNRDDKTYVEPDISVICDKSKLEERGCNGAPDFIIEVVSPSTKRMDYSIKLFKYHTSGVREYWIINPISRTVNVHDFVSGEKSDCYSFDDEISSCIYPDFKVRPADLVAQFLP
jgi:Uma2 family endonuclease